MNRIAIFCIVGVMTIQATTVAQGAFTPPTETGIIAAAKDPGVNMAALLKEASPEQAAQVVKLVVARVLGLGLSSDGQRARITAVISVAFAVVTPQAHMAFASAVGAAVAASGAIVATPGAVSRIQGAIALVGAEGAALAQAFGTSYQAAMQKLGGTSQKTKDDPPPIIPPPIASGYEGQTL